MYKVNALVADRVLIADRLTHLLTFKKYIKLTLSKVKQEEGSLYIY